MAILKLQEEYLSSKDPSKLEDLWMELVRLGVYQIGIRDFGFKITDADVYDFVDGIIFRLVETGRPVVKGNPSGYVKMALFYKAKQNQRRHVTMDESSLSCQACATDVCDAEVEGVILDVLANVEIPDDLYDDVEDILFSRKSIDEAKAQLGRSNSRRLMSVMEEIRKYVSTSHM